MWNKIVTFLQEVRRELENVTWPTKDEVKNSTVVVLVTVLLVASYVFTVDWMMRVGFFDLIRRLFRRIM